MYGLVLKQQFVWNERLLACLVYSIEDEVQSTVMTLLDVARCVFKDDRTPATCHLDDLLVMDEDDTTIDKVRSDLMKTFTLKDLGTTTSFLRTEMK